jgi:beta-glucosidase
MDIGSIIKKMTLQEKVELCIDASMLRTVTMPNLGIPELIMTDGTNGVRLQNIMPPDPRTANFLQSLKSSFDSDEALSMTYPATCFPTGSSLACSFDVALTEKISSAVAEECKSLGVGLLYGPGLNTRRNPLDGRGFEYYSEDPCLAGELAAAYVKGLQNNGVAGCVKHFVCNNSNYMRTIYDNIVEERALREIYFAAFERVIKKAKPAMVMGSYNLINGVQACENHWLLTEILREEWGYEGVVISDCGAVKDHINAFLAGIDFEIPHSKIAIDKLVQGIEEEKISEQELNKHCERVLELVLTYTREGKQRPQIDFQKHHELAREAALECAVLLKNDEQLLPLNKNEIKHIAIVGDWAEHPVYQGTGCAIVRAQKEDIPLHEIRQICGDSVQVLYEPGYINPNENDDKLLSRAVVIAQNADAVIVFAGSNLPLETDEYNRKDINIEHTHEQLIRAISAVNKNVIVVLMNGESVEMPWIENVKAVLDMWYSGEGCGYAVAQLLFGEQNPCGKLAVTMPIKLSDIPGYLNLPGENHKHYYEEGIFVGYRYYEKKVLKPLFPFGYGLSYTQFDYSDVQLSKLNITLPETVTVSFSITNSGKRVGCEIVQLYIADGHSRLKRPVKELKYFAKVDIEPLETKLVSFELSERDFAYFDPAFDEWVVDTGTFELLIGASSQDIRLQKELHVINTKRYNHKFMRDSHYLEIFEDAHAKKVFFDSLVEWGLIKQSDITPELENEFLISFWGLAQHFELVASYKVTEEMIDEVVRKMNNRLE